MKRDPDEEVVAAEDLYAAIDDMLEDEDNDGSDYEEALEEYDNTTEDNP